MIKRRNLWVLGLIVAGLYLLLAFALVQAGEAKKYYGATLIWDRNAEGDLAGYKIYYKVGESGHPYNGTVFTVGPSPITYPVADAHDSSSGVTRVVPFSFLVAAPPAGEEQIIRVAVTAFDTEGLESGYSNELDIPVPGFWLDGKPPGAPADPVVVEGSIQFRFEVAY